MQTDADKPSQIGHCCWLVQFILWYWFCSWCCKDSKIWRNLSRNTGDEWTILAHFFKRVRDADMTWYFSLAKNDTKIQQFIRLVIVDLVLHDCKEALFSVYHCTTFAWICRFILLNYSHERPLQISLTRRRKFTSISVLVRNNFHCDLTHSTLK